FGGCCDYSAGWRLKPGAQTPPFCGSPTDSQRDGTQTQLCEDVGLLLSGSGQLLLYQLQPPSPPSTTTMLIQLVNMTANLTAPSRTESIPTQQHSQIELAVDSEWSERLKGTKRGSSSNSLSHMRRFTNTS
ncbi:hypothetical protein KUCAC02_001307, partial [Chaenocephalus aceratus]